MDNIEIEARAIVARAARKEPGILALDEDFAEGLGLDSIDRLTLLAAAEHRLGVVFADARLSDINTLRDLITALRTEAGRVRS